MKRVATFVLLLGLLLGTLGSVRATTEYAEPFGAEYTQTVDSAFTFAFVGDTQIVAHNSPEQMNTIYQWLIDHKDEKNIRFVAGLGDITDKPEDYEWEAAMAAIQKMDGILPYSLIRGNHDDMYLYTKYVSYGSYISQLDGMYQDNVFNTYQTVEIGTLKYLFLCLDHGPTDEALQWACQVVESHPNHNVIVTTHGYINGKGELLTPETTSIPPSQTNGFNDAPVIWERLVKKYENIIMVVCGHIGTAPEIVWYEAVGDHGNKIPQVLVNPQRLDKYEGASGLVALFHFSADGTQVQVENYSTIRQVHYGPGVTFTVGSAGGNALESPVNWPLIIGGAAGAVAVLAGGIVLVIWRLRKKAPATREENG